MTTTDLPDPSATRTSDASAATSEPVLLRVLRVIALVETVSFAILLGCSVLKRTTSFNAVPVMGPVHGVLFLALVALVLQQRDRLAWSARKTLLALTLGSPFAHFFVRSTR
jgi:integral membrane protein